MCVFADISSFKFTFALRPRQPVIIPSLLSPQQTLVPVQLCDGDAQQQHQDQQNTGAQRLTGKLT